MEFTNLELQILNALIQNDSEKDILLKQMENAKVKSRDYTGVGVYIEISITKKSPLLSKSNRYIEETPKAHLYHPELSAGAGVLLWFSNGKISTLELYTFDGDWPQDEDLFELCELDNPIQ